MDRLQKDYVCKNLLCAAALEYESVSALDAVAVSLLMWHTRCKNAPATEFVSSGAKLVAIP